MLPVARPTEKPVALGESMAQQMRSLNGPPTPEAIEEAYDRLFDEYAAGRLGDPIKRGKVPKSPRMVKDIVKEMQLDEQAVRHAIAILVVQGLAQHYDRRSGFFTRSIEAREVEESLERLEFVLPLIIREISSHLQKSASEAFRTQLKSNIEDQARLAQSQPGAEAKTVDDLLKHEDDLYRLLAWEGGMGTAVTELGLVFAQLRIYRQQASV